MKMDDQLEDLDNSVNISLNILQDVSYQSISSIMNISRQSSQESQNTIIIDIDLSTSQETEELNERLRNNCNRILPNKSISPSDTENNIEEIVEPQITNDTQNYSDSSNTTTSNDGSLSSLNNINDQNSSISGIPEDIPEVRDNNINFIENNYDDITDESSNEDLDYENLIHEIENDRRPFYTDLLELLQNDDSNETITANLVVNKIEVLFAIMKFAMVYSLPNSGVADLCKMFNAFFDSTIIPDSRYKIDKLFYPGEGLEYHAVCSGCKNYIKMLSENDKQIQCNVCEKVINVKDPCYNDFFVMINIRNEVQDLIEKNQEFYMNVMNNEETEDFVDIYSGQKYKDFVSSLPENERKSYLSLTFNSDGSPIFKSSKCSVWPIQVNPNEIPLSIRNKRPITCAVWFGHDKPNMNIFLNPFVENINKLSEDGIKCTINNEEKIIKVYALCCCVDTVARAPIQGFIQFNGYYGCNWCLHPGKLVQHNTGASVKYPLLNEFPPRRTEEMTLHHIQEAIDNNDIIYGVKKATPILNLKKFNIIDGFVPDSMHCVALGVVKQFSEYWFNTANRQYSISNVDQGFINENLKNFKVPTLIARLSRSIAVKKFWKSREHENWLLYYSLPALTQINSFQRYLKHWSLLVEACHLLMSNAISVAHLMRADVLLKQFVAETQYLYSKDAMTYNVHQLIHLPQSVADWGPLWAHFGYPFESGNGQIIRTVHAAKGVISQICRNISVRDSLRIMQNHLANDDSPVRKYCYYLENRCTLKTIKIGNRRYFGRGSEINEEIANIFNLSLDHALVYQKMIKNQAVFKSCKKELQRSDNSFAKTSDNKYIRIEDFIVDIEHNVEYVICKKLVVENFSQICTHIKKVIRIQVNLSIIETSKIENLCVFMTVQNQRYISAILHMYWYS